MISLVPPPPAITIPDRESFTIPQISALSGVTPHMLRVMWKQGAYRAVVIETPKQIKLRIPRDEAERLIRSLLPRFATEADGEIEAEGQD